MLKKIIDFNFVRMKFLNPIFFSKIFSFDTTANSLALTCRRLALHPDVQAQLVEEFEGICGVEEDGEVFFLFISRLNFIPRLTNF